MAGLLALPEALAGTMRPRPGHSAGFRLLARAIGALTINRVYCGLSATGQVCVDSTGSNFQGGGFWPKGTADQYIFSSGFQLAGIVGDAPGNPWTGDTSSAAFFHPAGFTDGEPVRPVFNYSDPADLAAWPEAANVPMGDASQDLFDPLLRGRQSASQSDVWWLTWEGNPAIASFAVRPHPLGVLLEQRGMGWNFPAGNEDIVYFIYTVYNVTSTEAADYSNVRPAMREILLEKARDFQRISNAAYDVTLPAGGYAIQDLYVAFAADMDVGNAGLNYASVNLPFGLGYTYDHSFGQLDSWTFDPAIFGPPFFAGTGFAGVKYLRSPLNGAGEEVGLTVFGNTINQGSFDDPLSAQQLYRYLSATLDPSQGDSQCNNGNPKVTHICFINNAQPDDIRFFQSSGPMTLAPGEFGSIVVAYIFAAPVADPVCTPPCDLRPEDATILGDPARMAAGVNPIDRLTGYRGFTDANSDGQVQQEEFKVVPGSLLAKALVAQAVFDGGFLLPFAPDPPPFFLIPGNNQVTVLWRPSPTETSGDPFFASASSATVLPPGGGTPVPNPLFDPNYRQFDVEGYRVYRGRVDSPNQLALVAQFDYQGTFITDFQGQVNPVPGCAPELGINTVTVAGTDTTFGCPVPFDSLQPGVAPLVSVDIPLVGQIVQVKRGGRTPLATGETIILSADTAITGGASGAPELGDTGVPFTFLDTGVRSNLRYFYSVVAFDINSFQSGPSSTESPRTTKSVVPVAPGSNTTITGTVVSNIVGRGVAQDSIFTADPSIDAATGRFSGPFPPADGGDLHFAGQFASQVVSAPGVLTATLDSMELGSAYDLIPSVYYVTATTAIGSFQMVLPVVQDQFDADTRANQFYTAVAADATLAGRFGGGVADTLRAEFVQTLPGTYYTNSWGRGCINDADGLDLTKGCDYNGSRWFNGPSPANNETKADPNAGNRKNSATPAPIKTPNNAGELAGVVGIHQDIAYQTVQNIWRNVEGALAGAKRAADFNVYWGAGGTIDSVIDATHNVPVPFRADKAGATWGILNQSATSVGASADGRAELTVVDIGCVEPFKSFPSVGGTDPAAPGRIPCTSATAYPLSNAAVPGPIAYMSPSIASAASNAPAAGPGFVMYLAGNIFTFELPPGGALPAAGTVWSMRSYVGGISGGHGDAGNDGDYVFTPKTRPFTAVGATVRLAYSTVNQIHAATENDLTRVHTVPDPYYVTSQFERTTQGKVIQFVNLPADAIIRIYSSSGILITLLEHHSATFGGAESWNVRSRNNQVVASGVYFYHIESGDARRVGRFTLVNFAE